MGAMLFWPGDTFGRPTYALMTELATEEAWACAFGVTSYLQFRIVLNGRQHTLWAHYFALWNSLLWAVVVGSMLLSVYPPPAAIAGEISHGCRRLGVGAPMILMHYARARQWTRTTTGRATWPLIDRQSPTRFARMHAALERSSERVANSNLVRRDGHCVCS